jgi:hypothetical protein
MSRLYVGPLVVVDRSVDCPGGFEVYMRRSHTRIDLDSGEAHELAEALAALASALPTPAATPVLPPLLCPNCGAQAGPRTHAGSVVLRCPHCQRLEFWPPLRF